MKNLKIVFTTIALIAFIGANGQQNKQVENETVLKKYEIQKEGKTVDYQIKIESKKSSPVTLAKEDKGKKEQDRVFTPQKVTKYVSIDSDMDNRFEKVLEVSYVTKANESFKIYPTKKGFTINVIGKKLDYDLFKSEYEVDTEHGEFFDIRFSSESK